MTIMVEYDSTRGDPDRPFDVPYDVTVRIVTKTRQAGSLILLAQIWESVSTADFNDLIRQILDMKMHWST